MRTTARSGEKRHGWGEHGRAGQGVERDGHGPVGGKGHGRRGGAVASNASSAVRSSWRGMILTVSPSTDSTTPKRFFRSPSITYLQRRIERLRTARAELWHECERE